MRPLKQYLFDSGTLDRGNSAEIEAVKQKYRKDYLSEKKREHRANHRECTLSFTFKEASLIEKAGENHGLKFYEYAKKAILAYIEKGFIVPDEEQIHEIELLLRNTSDSIKLIARKITFADRTTIGDLQQRINNLEDRIVKAMRNPLSVEEFIDKGIQEHPQLLGQLQIIIRKYANNQD